MGKVITQSGLMFAIAGLLAIAPPVSAAEEAASLAPVAPARATGLHLGSAPLPQNPAPLPSPTAYRSNSPPEILDNYGLIRSVQGGQVSVRLLNGETKSYLLASNVPTYPSLRRGGLVGFDTDKSGNITRLAPPQVRKVYRGTLVIVDGKKIGMVTPTGERFITTLSKQKIARMGLAPGQPIKITQYQGTWATKVCQPGALNDDDAQPVIAEQGPTSLGGPVTPLDR